MSEKDRNTKLQITTPEAFKYLENKSVWLCSDPTGKPISPKTGTSKKHTTPEVWGVFQEVVTFSSSREGYGCALVVSSFTEKLICIDLDDVIGDQGEINIWAQQTVNAFDSYTEISNSGRGLHIFVYGLKPGKKTKTTVEGKSVEVYGSADNSPKPIRITGKIFKGLDVIKEKQEVVEKLYLELFGKEKQQQEADWSPSPQMTDDEVIGLCRKAKNTEKFSRLFDEGDLTRYGEDASAADLALMNLLVFYTQDEGQLERLFFESALGQRDKWIHREDYRRRTIEKALLLITDTYKGERIEKPVENTGLRLRSVGISEFLANPLPPRELILDPWLHRQGTVMIYAWRGVGKTWFALNVAHAIGSGGQYLGWNVPQPRRVLYIDGEMPGAAMQERLADIVVANKGHGLICDDDYFQLLTNDLQESGIPSLDTLEGQCALQPFFDKAEVIFLDNLSSLTCQPENESQGWQMMQSWILRQRRQGKTIVLMHHAGKGGMQRGTSKREDVLDVVMVLKHPKDYSPEDGACFELDFEKTRGLTGHEVRPLVVRAKNTGQGMIWEAVAREEDIKKRVEEMLSLNLSVPDICQELDVSKATFYRMKKRFSIP